MIRVRGGAGLGDALYVRAIVEHLVRAGEKVTVCTDYRDAMLGSGATVEPFSRMGKFNVIAHYTTRKKYPDTNQWQDVCITAGVPPIPLAITWQQRNAAFVQELRAKADGRALVLVNGGRIPMNRTDGFGRELMPEKRAFDIVLYEFRDCFTVRIGHKQEENRYALNVSLDLTGGTTVSDLLDLAQACDGIVGQCGFPIPLAEAFDVPAMFVWSAKGMAPQMHDYIRRVVPRKVLSKESSMFVVDDWTEKRIREEVRGFRLIR